MKIAYVASEITPYASTGGLAEVAGSLPPTLARLGCSVTRFMPCYRAVLENSRKPEPTDIRITVPVGMRAYAAEVLKTEDGGVSTYFIRRDEFFDRSQLYNLPDRDYEDNFERFVFFQKAVVALIDRLELKPDLVMCNDWQTGLIPYFLEYGTQGKRRGRREKCVFTIHNIAYQGIYPDAEFALTNLPFHAYSVDTFEYYGKINCMKAGITGSDLVITVSPGYAKEVLTPEGGFGLDGLLRSVQGRFVGILNGIDTDVWNPATDPHLPAPYTANDLSGKTVCRRLLSAKMSVNAGENTAIVAMISRLEEMKGLDILGEAMPGLMDREVVFVLLGAGHRKYEEMASGWAKRWPGRVGVLIGYNAPLAHLIQAGADIMLIPSKMEPCGLTQFYSQRYGTIPVVRAVGGLADSVIDPSEGADASGFKFQEFSGASLLAAVDRALTCWRSQKKAEMIKHMMSLDVSWNMAARKYLAEFQRLVIA